MPITVDPKSWAGASERDKFLARSSRDMMEAAAKEIADKVSIEKVMDITGLKAFADEVSANPDKYLGTPAALVGSVIDFLLTRVTGLDIPDSAIAGALSGSTSEDVRRSFGSILLAFLDGNLDISKVAEGFQSRNPGDGERDSMARLLGTAFRIQVGDMAMDWITQALPFGLASGLKDVAERFNDAMNLDDALEDIIQVPMQQVIEKGMQQWYLRQILPEDYSEAEAYKLRVMDKIPDDVFHKVLDNQGVRKDIREHLLDLAASNLNESDLDQLYQHNLLDRNKVKEQYRAKAFTEPDAELKTKLVEGTRRWKLEEKLFELLGNLYRDGVATREECTPHLEHFGYDPDEQDMWFQIQELERKQRRFLSNKEVMDLVGAKVWTPAKAIEYYVLQGATLQDATDNFGFESKEDRKAKAKAIEAKAKAAVAKLPKAVRDQCDDLFSPEAILKKLLGELIELIPTDPTGLSDLLDLQQLIECALKGITSTPAPTP